MGSLDQLPGDQRAVLQLVLARGRSYAEIARLLSINPDAVRERALTALDAIGPQTRASPENRRAICDYLLGQLEPAEVPRVRRLLAGSAAERAWAQTVSGELGEIASRPLPDIPQANAVLDEDEAEDQVSGLAAPSPTRSAPEAEAADAATPATAPVPPQPSVSAPPMATDVDGGQTPADDARQSGEKRGRRSVLRRRKRNTDTLAEAGQAPPPPPPVLPDEADDDDGERPSSRRGGMVVIGLGVIVIIVVLVLVLHHGSNSGSSSSPAVSATAPITNSSSSTTGATGATGSTGATSSTGATGATGSTGSTGSTGTTRQINLNPPAGSSSKAVGIADIIPQGSATEVAIVAQHVPPNTTKPPNAYEVWLYNSPTDAVSLGFVNPGVGKKGKLVAAGKWPSNAASYKELIVTTETTDDPKTPGPILLEGAVASIS